MKTSIVRKQRGALGLMMAMIMLVLVLFAALAIDMARLTYQQQALQSVADIAALEVSKENPYYIDPANSSGIESELRDKYFAEGKIDSGDEALTVEFGSAAIVDNYWTFSDTPPATPSFDGDYSAAQVKVTKTVPKSMIAGGLFNGETVELIATAAIQQTGVVIFGIGTELLSVNTEQSALLNSIFSGILDSSVDLSAASYQGLADTKITLGSLVSETGLVSINDILSSKLKLKDRPDILALGSDVQALFNQVSALDVKVGDVLGINPGRESAALATTLSALDIIRAAAIYAGNGESGISIPTVDANILGLASLTASLDIIKAPQFKVVLLPIKAEEKPSVESEQVNVVLTANLDILDLVGGLISSIKIDPIIITAEGVQAKATLIKTAYNNGNPYAVFNIERIFTSVQIQPIGINLKLLFGIIDIPITLNVDITIIDLEENPRPSTVYLNKVPDQIDITGGYQLNTHISLGSGNLVTNVLSLLISTLTPLINSVLEEVLLPTLKNVGIGVGTTTLWVDAAGTTQYGIIK